MSISGSFSRRASTFQPFKRRSDIDIVLENEDASYIHTYSTHDKIEGHVLVKLDRDTRLDDLTIMFEGQTTTCKSQAQLRLHRHMATIVTIANWELPFRTDS